MLNILQFLLFKSKKKPQVSVDRYSFLFCFRDRERSNATETWIISIKLFKPKQLASRSRTILTTIPNSYHNIQRSLAVSGNNENSINGSYDDDAYHSNGNSIPIGNWMNPWVIYTEVIIGYQEETSSSKGRGQRRAEDWNLEER